jgi:hypothetical protein
MRVMDVFRERTMGELRAAEQEHRRAKAAHQEAERSWQSERRALKEQHAVNDLHSSYPAFQRLHVRAVAYYHRVLCLRRPNLTLLPHVVCVRGCTVANSALACLRSIVVLHSAGEDTHTGS